MNLSEQARKRFCSRIIHTPRDVKVLLLAGGKGSRLRNSGVGELASITKMLVEIEDDHGVREPMLSATIRGLDRAGFSNIGILTSDDADAQGAAVEARVLRDFVDLPGLRLFREWQPLGTAGSVYAAVQHVDTDLVLVCPGDTLFPYERLVDGLVRHSAEGRDATWFVTSNPDASAQNRDRMLIDPVEQRLIMACEGEHVDAATHTHVVGSARATSAGAMLMRTTWLTDMFVGFVTAAGSPAQVDLYRDLVPWALQQNEQVFVHDIQTSAPDLGTADRLFQHGRKSNGWAS